MSIQAFLARAGVSALAPLALAQLTFAAGFTHPVTVGVSAATGVPFRPGVAAWQPHQTRAWCTLSQALVAQGVAPQSGEMVITEFMKDPAAVVDTRGEWIEFYNNLPWRVNMEGWMLADDGGSQHVINTGGAGLRARPGHYLVLGNNNDPTLNGGVTIDYVWTGFSLSNTTDQIMLQHADGSIIDRVAYDSTAWPSVPGKAICLRNTSRDVLANDDGANWCAATTPLVAGGTDTGTPKQHNDVCP